MTESCWVFPCVCVCVARSAIVVNDRLYGAILRNMKSGKQTKLASVLVLSQIIYEAAGQKG